MNCRQGYLSSRPSSPCIIRKQASVIGELYEKLSEAEMYVSHSVHPIQFDGRSAAEKAEEADEKCVDLARFYNRHRIYLNEDVCQKLDSILAAMRKSVVKLSVSQMEPRGAGDVQMRSEGHRHHPIDRDTHELPECPEMM